MKSILAVLFFFVCTANAHREHGAHQHGVGTLGLAFDGAKGKFDMKVPAESIIGFEHEAKKAKDIKKRDEKLALFEQKFSEMLTFDKSLNCKMTKLKVEVQLDEHSKPSKKKKTAAHSDFVAEYLIDCEKSPLGSQLIVDFQSQFKKLKKIELQIVVDNLQKAETVSKPAAKIELK